MKTKRSINFNVGDIVFTKDFNVGIICSIVDHTHKFPKTEPQISILFIVDDDNILDNSENIESWDSNKKYYHLDELYNNIEELKVAKYNEIYEKLKYYNKGLDIVNEKLKKIQEQI